MNNNYLYISEIQVFNIINFPIKGKSIYGIYPIFYFTLKC